MKRSVQNLAVQPDTPILEAIEVIDRGAAGIAVVVDDAFRLLGTVTDGDVRRAILRGHSLKEPVDRIMSTDPVTAAPGTPDAQLLATMEQHKLRHLPLVADDGELVHLTVLDDLVADDHPDIPVLLMAGGLGTRLRPLTEETPKPLLPIGGNPILETLVKHLNQAGLRRFFISTRFLAEKIQEHFGDGSDMGVQIEYLRETDRLGTAGALHMLQGAVTDPLLVMNGDVLTNFRVSEMIRFHRERDAAITLAAYAHEVAVPFGVLEMGEEDARVTGIAEKPTFRYFVNAGIYLIEPSVLGLVPTGEYFDMPQLIEAALAEGHRVVSFPLHEYWRDIGCPDDYERANLEFAEFFDGDGGGS